MAELRIRSGLVGTVDLGFDLSTCTSSQRSYHKNQPRALTVQNAQRGQDVKIEYSLMVGGVLLHPLGDALPKGFSLRSLVAVTDRLRDNTIWTGWSEKKLFDRERRRADGSSSPALLPALRLPDGSLAEVTHVLQIVSDGFDGCGSRRHPKDDRPQESDAFSLQLPGQLRIYAGPPEGPLQELLVHGHSRFDALEVCATSRPDDPSDSFPPG